MTPPAPQKKKEVKMELRDILLMKLDESVSAIYESTGLDYDELHEDQKSIVDNLEETADMVRRYL